MQVLLTISSDDARDELEQSLVAEAASMVASGTATRAAVNVRVGGDEWDRLKDFNDEHDAVAMVKLWDPAPVDAAVKFSMPEGARLVGAYGSDEVVQKDYEQTWPTGTASPGVKLVCLVHRKPDIGRQQYLDHWRDNHGPLAVRIQPGFWHYVQNHVSDLLTDDTPDFDGIGELHFETVDDVFSGMFADDEAQRLIYEDTERFMVHETSTVLVTKETLVGF
jgi:EthD domain